MSTEQNSVGCGVILGLLTVVVVIILGAMLGYKGNEAPEPSPTSDRPPIIVNQP